MNKEKLWKEYLHRKSRGESEAELKMAMKYNTTKKEIKSLWKIKSI